MFFLCFSKVLVIGINYAQGRRLFYIVSCINEKIIKNLIVETGLVEPRK